MQNIKLRHGMRSSMMRAAGLLALSLLTTLACAQASDYRIGFVNTERLFREAAPAKRAQQKLEKEFAGRDADILRGVAAAGRRPTDVRHLIVTHAHPDHIGSLAAVRSATGAAVYCHPADAPIVTAGGGFRPLRVTPGVVNWLVWRLFIRPILRRFARVDPTPDV